MFVFFHLSPALCVSALAYVYYHFMFALCVSERKKKIEKEREGECIGHATRISANGSVL